MKNYIARRILQAIPVVLLITFLSFSMIILLPGDPLAVMTTEGQAMDPEVREVYIKEFNLDKPIPVQYAIWLGRVFKGDLGKSTLTGRPISTELKSRLPATLQLGLAGIMIGLLIGIPAGIAAAVWRNSVLDRVFTLGSVSGVAIPDFWFGLMLILFFSVKLRWLPALGYESIFSDPIGAIELMILPALVTGWGVSAIITRQLRSSMLEILQQDYVRTARAKGLRELNVVWGHALRNALLPVVTILGLLVARVVAGSVIIEQIFAIPGVGRMLVGAVSGRDFPAVQGVVLLLGISVVVMNIVTDVAYTWLDPRIRYG